MEDNDIAAIKDQLAKELARDSLNYQAIAELNQKLLASDKSTVRFSVDARHIHRLGFELVGRQDTALGELIKNAYDADATEVSITFSNYDQPGGQLVIEDDGSGMTEQVIRNAWMRLSTSDKERSPISDKYRRSRAGRKGIGRFAVERLGSELLLESRVEGWSFGIRVLFRWDEMLRPDVDIALVPFQIEQFSKAVGEHGTTLKIKSLRDRWTDKLLEKVWKSVVLLQPPFKTPRAYRGSESDSAKSVDPGFSVVINGQSSEEVRARYSLTKTFLEQRTANIRGRIDKDGKALIEVKSEKLAFDDKTTLDKSYLAVGEVSFEADYFISSPELITGFSLSTLREMGSEYGGIRIYRDGFRVLPYGEPRDDWLRLSYDMARRSLLVPANNLNFFGQVELSSEDNALIEETSSREGLIDNEAFAELAEFVRSGLEWATLRVAAARERKQTASQRDFKSRGRRPSEDVQKLLQSIGSPETASDGTSAGAAAEALDAVKDEVLRIVEDYEHQQAQREHEHLHYEEMLRILASLGTSIAVFSHEIRGALSGFSNAVTRLKMLLARISAVEAAADQMTDIDAGLGKLKDVASYVMSLIAHTSSREKSELALHGEIHEFVSQFRHYLDARGVEFHVDVTPDSLRTAPMHRSEIHSVLFNFLTNAIKAMDRSSTGLRKIKITARQVDSRVCIGFQDTGDGVALENAERIFDAFFTTHQYGDDQLAGPGSGLGLKIVRDISHANGGDVCLSPAENGYKTRFDFLVPAAKTH